jgi:biopolymer transport protein ExbD
MMKLALAALLLTAACQKKDEPKPVPTEAPKPAEKPAEKPKPVDTPCVLAVSLTDKVTYEGGGIKGESTVAALDKAVFTPLAGKCSAEITAEDTVGYQDIIRTMDLLVTAGITDVGLGGTKSPKVDAPTSSGKLGPVSKDALKSAVVIVMSRTEVTVSGKKVGKPADATLGAAIVKALPPNPTTSPIVIVQADASLSFAPIRAALDAAKQAGYDNVLFAVKNK